MKKGWKIGKRVSALIFAIAFVVAEIPANVLAYDAIKIKTPFSYEGIEYRDIGGTSSNNDGSDVIEALFNDGAWSGSTKSNLGQNWMAIARMAYASKFGSKGTNTYLSINGGERSMALFYEKPMNSENRMCTAASTNKDAVFETNLINNQGSISNRVYVEKDISPMVTYAKNATMAVNQMMVGIDASSCYIGDSTKLDELPTQPRANNVKISVEDKDKLTAAEGPAAFCWYLNAWWNDSKKYMDSNYAGLGVLFTNIKMTPILPDGIGIESSNPDMQNDGENETTGVYNATSAEVDVSQSLEESHTSTATNSISKSSAFTFSEGLSISHTASAGLSIGEVLNLGSETTTTASFTAEQALETAWSEEKQVSDTSSTTRTVSMSLPAYTRVNLKQQKSTWDTTVSYDCPIYLTYDVDIIAFSDLPSSTDTTAHPQSEIIASFKGDAARDFAERFSRTGAASDDNGINWGDGIRCLYTEKGEADTVHDQLNKGAVDPDLHYRLIGDQFEEYSNESLFNGESKNNMLIYKSMYNIRPMIVTGGSLKYKRSGTTYTIDGIVPYYPLTKVETGDTKEYSIETGDKLSVNQIPLYGKNKLGYDFYSFQGSNGTWTLIDANGVEIPSGENDVALLRENPISNYIYLLGKEEGEVYLRYSPDASEYEKGMVADSAKITIPIKVNGKPEVLKNYKVKYSGGLEVEKNVPIDLNMVDGIKAYVEDENGYIISNMLQWKAKDQTASAGIQIDDMNQMTITKAGTYEIKPYYQVGKQMITNDEWLTVQVKEPLQLKQIAMAFPDNELTKITDNRKVLEYDLPSMLHFMDQNQKEWTGQKPDVTFSLQRGVEGAQIENNENLKVMEAGTYKVFAKADGYAIDPIIITVTDHRSAPPVLPSITGLMPERDKLKVTGGNVAFTLIGKNLKDGIQVKAGNIRGWTSGNGTVQKVTLKFPANKSKTSQKVYPVTYSFDGKTFEQSPAKVTVKYVDRVKLKSLEVKGYRDVKVKWSKKINGSGYQIQTSTSKKFSKNKRETTTIEDYKTTKELLRLDYGKKYYVRVRAYAQNGRSRIYGEWSNVRKIRVK